jgi:predicted methyltransferase
MAVLLFVLIKGFLAPVLVAAAAPQPAAVVRQEPSSAEANADNLEKPTEPDKSDKASKPDRPEAKDRAAKLVALLAHLKIGPGAKIADIGAGSGVDTWTFAEVVGPTGTVYAEEITPKLIQGLQEGAKKRNLPQVQPVLGREDAPMLPQETLDLAYMRFVYHHVSRPREMLLGIWRALKPGGYFVVVDRHRGTLRDWVPREARKDKHYWIAETTVVRDAREAGFAFVACGEEFCESKEPFLLIFQRPKELKEPLCDPDAPLPFKEKDGYRHLLPLSGQYQRPVFIALGESREWFGPILRSSGGQGLDVVLEEWATYKEERPPLPPGVALPASLTKSGNPRLEGPPIDVVFFLDTYHLLFHGKTLLAQLHERLVPAGCVYVLDRVASAPLGRCEASHHRRIDPETVKQDLTAAGFHFWAAGPPPAADRFLLLFTKEKPEAILLESDPLVGGPELACPPQEWLNLHCWRLRGLRTSQGKLVRLANSAGRKPAEKLPGETAAGREIWRLPGEQLALVFRKTEKGYILDEIRPTSAP